MAVFITLILVPIFSIFTSIFDSHLNLNLGLHPKQKMKTKIERTEDLWLGFDGILGEMADGVEGGKESFNDTGFIIIVD